MQTDGLTPQQFADFSDVIAGTLGIKMPPAKRVMLQSRLLRRTREVGLSTVAEYHARFFQDPEHQSQELEHLLNLATTNKTDFFREADHFAVLTKEVLPAWRRLNPSGGTFRVWCAGCASGEEAYTLAMCLAEEQAVRPFDYSILATDVSTRALGIALRGVYAEERIAPVPAALRTKYLMRSLDRAVRQYRVIPELRSRIRFGHLNFLSEDYGIRDTMDVVFFRNVMIYFDRPTQQQVVTRLCRHLRPGGTFFTAHAETLQGLGLPLTPAGTAVYQLEKRRE